VTDPDLTRRRAVGVAVGGLSLPLLAACGGASMGTPGSAPPVTRGSLLIAAGDVPVGGGVVLASAEVVVTQPTKGRFEGFSAICTHQGCLLADVADGTINCSCHGSQFSMTDGTNVAGPAGMSAGSIPPLPRVPVKKHGSNVVEA
jgi:Rieske Fe-S protein